MSMLRVRPNILLCLAIAALAIGATGAARADDTAETYLKDNPQAKLYPLGAYKIEGQSMICGKRPTVVDPNFASWGGALPGFLIMNPKKTEGLPKAVKLYVYSHECGHQFVGADESAADCFAIRRGIRRGWLNAEGLAQICSFISQLKGDAVHPPGANRCEYMRQCFVKYGGQ